MRVGFYAGLKRNTTRRAFLLGPYNTHEEAAQHVERARVAAEAIDPFCHFDSAGVFKLEAAALPAGRLNDRLGLHTVDSKRAAALQLWGPDF